MNNSFDSYKLRKDANGMLPVAGYDKIYDTAYNAVPGDFLEVGTAHGAATIALAQGMKDAGRGGHIHTIDKIVGGSRDRYGGLEKNKDIILGNFKKYGVDQNITLHIGTSSEVADKLPADISFALMMLDADGAVDRDLSLFYNRLKPGGAIIIDDYHPDINLRREKGGVKVYQKHRLTKALVDFFEQKGLFESPVLVGETYFAVKPESQIRPVDFGAFDVMPIYRSLVFAQGQMHNPVVEAIGHFMRSNPFFYDFFKNIYLRFRQIGKVSG